MRLIDADDVMQNVLDEIRYKKSLYTSTVRRITQKAIDAAPTIDPESLRPTAHIMRGTVRDTYDNAFCSSCRSCLNGDEYFEEVLAHRYKYCPYCSARFVNEKERW